MHICFITHRKNYHITRQTLREKLIPVTKLVNYGQINSHGDNIFSSIERFKRKVTGNFLIFESLNLIVFQV